MRYLGVINPVHMRNLYPCIGVLTPAENKPERYILYSMNMHRKRYDATLWAIAIIMPQLFPSTALNESTMMRGHTRATVAHDCFGRSPSIHPRIVRRTNVAKMALGSAGAPHTRHARQSTAVKTIRRAMPATPQACLGNAPTRGGAASTDAAPLHPRRNEKSSIAAFIF